MSANQLHVLHVACFEHKYTDWQTITSVGRRQKDPLGYVFERRFCKCIYCGHVKIDPKIS